MNKKEKWKIKQANAKYKSGVSHNFSRRVCNWSYCSGCGLVALSNEITRRAMAKPCPSMEDL